MAEKFLKPLESAGRRRLLQLTRHATHPLPCPCHRLLQAVLALRGVVLGRWAVVGPQARQATLQFLLHTALAQLAADPRRLLRTQVRWGRSGGLVVAHSKRWHMLRQAEVF